MTKKLVLGIVLMLSFTMVSCGSQNVATNSNGSETTSSEDTSSAETEVTEEKNDDATSSDSEENKDDSESKEISQMPIYSIDVNTEEPNEVKKVEVSSDATLQEKLEAVAKSVSETNFDNLTIEVQSVDTIDGKKVATINLKDSGDKTWHQKFQGSTGGRITSSTLIENFLQTNNKSNQEWIDGVKFLYNNEVIEYEHVADLSTVIYK